MKIALIASHVIQYQAPFFRLLAAEPGLDLEVIFCSTDGAKVYRDAEMQTTFRWDLDLLGGYRHRFLRNFGFGEGYTRLINPGDRAALLFRRYDAAIFFLGWGTISSLLGIAACRMSGTPVLLFGDSSFPPPETTFRSRMRAGLLRTIFRLTDRFLVSGVLNAEYYRHYGADPRRFSSRAVGHRQRPFRGGQPFAPGEREAMRARFGIGDDRHGHRLLRRSSCRARIR